MLKGLFVALISAAFIFGIGKLSFAQHDQLGHEHGTSSAAADAVSKESVNAGNKICPVSGDQINEATKAAYEYKGKIYNLCCAGCIEEFKNNPEKYIQIIEEEKKK
ncbi:MAG: YHS domain-containing protein [Candidatus Omnitrophica bacterium]|nr:YHS domain-containing protein [Candidatus Omnitrophota bacterium]